MFAIAHGQRSRLALLRTAFIAVFVVICAAGVADAKKKDKDKDPGKAPKLKSREVFYKNFQRIPPLRNYMRDVMSSADLINYIRSKSATILTKKGYQPQNADLVENRKAFQERRDKRGYMYVETYIDIKKTDRRTFILKVKLKGSYYETYGGKRLARANKNVKKVITDKYRIGIQEAVSEAFAALEEKIPRYREY